MEVAHVDEAIELLEKANGNLQPDLLTVSEARKLLEAYARAQGWPPLGVATLAGRLDDAPELARATGTSLGKAKDTVATGKVLGGSVRVELALEPHVGSPIANRAEAEAARLALEARKKERAEPFERHLADAYAASLSGPSRGPLEESSMLATTRPWRFC